MTFPALQLGAATITAVQSDVTITSGVSAAGVAQSFMDQLAGMASVTLTAAFTYGGSGGTSATLTIDTALGAGSTWLPIAVFGFTTSSATKTLTISGSSARTDQALTLSTPSSDSGINVLGDRLRARLTTVGTYVSGTQIDLRAQPR